MRVDLPAILTPWNGEERCGIWSKHCYYELTNMSSSPATDFRMVAGEIRVAANLIGEKILGIWHSHEKKRSPSKTDLDFHPVGYEMAIVCDGVWNRFDPENGDHISLLTAVEETGPASRCVVCGDDGPRPMAFRLSPVCCGVCEQVQAGDLPRSAAMVAKAARGADALST